MVEQWRFKGMFDLRHVADAFVTVCADCPYIGLEPAVADACRGEVHFALTCVGALET